MDKSGKTHFKKQAPHYLSILPRQQDAECEKAFTMAVQVVGFPVPEVRWFRNNKEIGGGKESNPRYTFTFGIDGRTSCTINKLQYGDAGTYKVKAKNPYGTSINQTKVSVKSKYEMAKLLKEAGKEEKEKSKKRKVDPDPPPSPGEAPTYEDIIVEARIEPSHEEPALEAADPFVPIPVLKKAVRFLDQNPEHKPLEHGQGARPKLRPSIKPSKLPEPKAPKTETKFHSKIPLKGLLRSKKPALAKEPEPLPSVELRLAKEIPAEQERYSIIIECEQGAVERILHAQETRNSDEEEGDMKVVPMEGDADDFDDEEASAYFYKYRQQERYSIVLDQSDEVVQKLRDRFSPPTLQLEDEDGTPIPEGKFLRKYRETPRYSIIMDSDEPETIQELKRRHLAKRVSIGDIKMIPLNTTDPGMDEQISQPVSLEMLQSLIDYIAPPSETEEKQRPLHAVDAADDLTLRGEEVIETAEFPLELQAPAPESEKLTRPLHETLQKDEEMKLEIGTEATSTQELHAHVEGGLVLSRELPSREKGDTFGVLEETDEYQGDDLFARSFDLCEERRVEELEAEANKDCRPVSMVPPQVTGLPSPISVVEGEELKLNCEVVGIPRPDILVFRAGVPIKPDHRQHFHQDHQQFTLTIQNTSLQDTGTYTITALNSEGKIFQNFSVLIEPKSEDTSREHYNPPEFVKKPESLTVTEFDSVRLSAVVKGFPEPTVTWFKEGKLLKPSLRVRMFEEEGTHVMEIFKSSLMDAGHYTCTAQSESGAVFSTLRLTVEGLTEVESGTSTDADQKPSGKAATEPGLERISDLSSSDEDLFRECIVQKEFRDEERGVSLSEGDVVELLDQNNPNMWMVRLADDKRVVCFIPPSIVKSRQQVERQKIEDEIRPALAKCNELTVSGIRDSAPGSTEMRRRGKLSRSPSKKMSSTEQSSSEDEERMSESYPVYEAIADYQPADSTASNLKISEGQYVSVLDSGNSDRWLCQTRPTKLVPAKIGWLPPVYLRPRGTSRRKRKKDRVEESLKKDDALARRRSILTELLETERQYLKAVDESLQMYEEIFESPDLPDALRGKEEGVLRNMGQIYKFHNEEFLSDLVKCTNDPSTVGTTFLSQEDKFRAYIPFIRYHEDAKNLLEKKLVREYIECVEKEKKPVIPLTEQLLLPQTRLEQYETLLKDFLKYTCRSGESRTDIERAISMIMSLSRRAEQQNLLETIEGYPEAIETLGPLVRHDEFVMWDTEIQGRGKDRHSFLFKEKTLLARRKRVESPGDEPGFLYKSSIENSDIQINDLVLDDDRFELWYTSADKARVTFEARNVHAKHAWTSDLREVMKQQGVEEPDLPVDKVPDVDSHVTVKVPTPGAIKRRPSKTDEVKPRAKVMMDSDEEDSATTSMTEDFASCIEGSSTETSARSSYHTAQEQDEDTKPPNFDTTLPKNMECKESENIRLECTISGEPSPQVTWFRNNKPIKAGGYVVISKDHTTGTHTLTIEHATVDETGTYVAQARNRNGNMESVCKVNVLEGELEEGPPRIVRPLEDQKLKEGDEAVFQCRVRAEPEPDYIWLVDDAILHPAPDFVMRYDGDVCTLLIGEVFPEDAGVYTCRFTNEYGTIATSAELQVDTPTRGSLSNQAPDIWTPCQDTDILEGQEAKFECVVTGLPIPDVKWYFNGKPLQVWYKKPAQCIGIYYERNQGDLVIIGVNKYVK